MNSRAEAKAIERSFERRCPGRDIHDIKIYDLDPFITFVTRFFGRATGRRTNCPPAQPTNSLSPVNRPVANNRERLAFIFFCALRSYDRGL